MRCFICHGFEGSKRSGLSTGSAGMVTDVEGKEQVLCDDCAWCIFRLTGFKVNLKGYTNKYDRYSMFVE